MAATAAGLNHLISFPKKVQVHFGQDKDIAFHSETKEEYVVYRQLYGDNSLWLREKNMFLSKVDFEKYPDVKQQYRFELTDLTELNYLK